MKLTIVRPVTEVHEPKPMQLKCAAGCGKVLHYYEHNGPRGPVYVCSRCGCERTAA